MASCAAALTTTWTGPASASVTFDWVTVGNPGNAPDAETAFGAVAQPFRISKTEVTNSQYAVYLNRIDPLGTNPLGTYRVGMGDADLGGIDQVPGNPAGQRYVVKTERGNAPVNYMTWVNAARFVNWLHNGQGAGGTESGVYAISDGVSEARSANANFFLPSENEWYKAAYHDPSAGTAGVYFTYATGANSPPPSDQPGDDPAAANYFNNDGDPGNGVNDGFAVTGSTTNPTSQGIYPLTDSGVYHQAASPYGALDMHGNVWEWTEGLVGSFNRNARGGSYFSSEFVTRNTFRLTGANSDGMVGFRVAGVVGALILGDYNASGQVEQGDLDIVLQNWGTGTFTGDEAALIGGGPFDGTVDQNELDGVLQNWGSTAAPTFAGTKLPEPSSLAPLALALFHRRARGCTPSPYTA